MRKRETHIVRGMSRDLAVHRFDPNLVVDARNIRITTVKDNSSLLTVTNEKGTEEFSVSGADIRGTIIGSAVLNKLLVLFTTENGSDRIYKLKFTDSFTSATSYLLFPEAIGVSKSLNFQTDHPLETLPVYENEDIQKVYWVDGINQPRMINVAGDTPVSNGDSFNFNRKIAADYKMKITKYNTGGEFPAGTIQYCFNYFNKFGQETNIVDQSPLYYLSPKDSGLPADAMSTSSFLIELSNLDSNYEYVRLYSIVRTSENATPIARIVGDYKISVVRNPASWVVDNDLDTFDFEDASVVDINTGEIAYNLSDVYEAPEQSSDIEVPLLSTQAILVRSSGVLYASFSSTTGNRKSYIMICRDSRGIHVYRNTPTTIIKKSLLQDSYIGEVTAVDNGIIGSTIDASSLLFIGGQDIVAGTLASKDNTLFLGNIKEKVPNIGNIPIEGVPLKDFIRGKAESCIYNIDGVENGEFDIGGDESLVVSGIKFYDYPIDNNKSSYDTKSFKARENYRLGIIAQYNTGQWSEALWVEDLDEEFSPARNVFYFNYMQLNYKATYKKPGFKLTIPASVSAALQNAGFIRVAPIVVYPETVDRKVVCQGILSGTLFNVSDRDGDSPYSQSDWRFRSGYSWERVESEIQCNPIYTGPKYPIAYYDSDDTQMPDDDFTEVFTTQFYRDPNVLSFHSPDIEEDEELYTSELSNTRLRIIGISNLGILDDEIASAETAAEVRVFTTSEGDAKVSGPVPFKDKTSIIPYQRNPSYNVYGNTELSFPGYIDYMMGMVVRDNDGVETQEITSGAVFKFTTFLWHKKGTLSSRPMQNLINSRYPMTGLYSHKLTSELRYARTAFFQSGETPGLDYFNLAITPPKVVDADSPLTKFELENGNKKLYYGDMDKVLVPPFKDIPATNTIGGAHATWELGTRVGYPIEFMGIAYCDDSTDPNELIWEEEDERQLAPLAHSLIDIVPSGCYNKDPIVIQYKSPKHLVFSLTSDNPQADEIYQLGNSMAGEYHTFWMPEGVTKEFVNVLNGNLSDTIGGVSGIVSNSVLVGELYRDFTDEQSRARFGGTSDEAIANNIWKRCGDSVKLDSDSSITLYYKEGDTYVGRYDCLKSYPRTNEDMNQLVSIYSTELESRVNLDARYDKMRGLADNTTVRPTNFNLFNHAGYEQDNQFFTYKAIDYDRYKNSSFPNLIAFTLEKKPAADIDTWTSIPMTMTADAQGDLGEITKLTAFNDNLFLFQNRGIAQVLFNERVQIPTSDGQPIEITNGLKYGGLRYITNQIGLTNKWSLCTTPNGMYFVDDEKNTLYIFNGQQLQDLSSKHGFRTWFSAIDSHNIWNPSDYSNLRTFYDKVNADLYFMVDDESLVFSEQIGTFTSFMDYAKLPVMVNVNDKFFTFTKNETTGMNRTWEMFAGDFNSFFGNIRPYWLTFISNSDPTIDKIFDNLAWRSFEYSEVTDDFQGILQPLKTFDSLRVWNDHQDSGEVALYDQEGNMTPTLKKKFNVFRALVPRDKLGNWKGKGINRIRNTWSYIRLAKLNPDTDLMMFSDLDVDFFE